MRLLKLLLVWFALLGSLPPAHAKISLDPAKPLTDLLKEFRAAILTIIDKGSWEAQVVGAQSVNNASVFLRNLEATYENTVGKSVQDLDKLEKDALERVAGVSGHTLHYSILGGPFRAVGLERSSDRPPFIRIDVNSASKRAIIHLTSPR